MMKYDDLHYKLLQQLTVACQILYKYPDKELFTEQFTIEGVSAPIHTFCIQIRIGSHQKEIKRPMDLVSQQLHTGYQKIFLLVQTCRSDIKVCAILLHVRDNG